MSSYLDRTEVDQLIALALTTGATAREFGLAKDPRKGNSIALDLILSDGEELTVDFRTGVLRRNRLTPAKVTRKNPATNRMEPTTEAALRSHLLQDGGTTKHSLDQLLKEGKATRDDQGSPSPLLPKVTEYAPA